MAGLVARGETYASDDHPLVDEVETALGRRFGASGRACLFLGSGTSALLAAYHALDLEPGAEVLVPAQTFHATAGPLLWLGLRPVLCDCHTPSGLVDIDDAEAKVGPRTQALVVTHLWGRLADMRAARALCDRHGLALVEDCSHAQTAPSGSLVEAADASAFSLGTKKIVSGGLAGGLILRSGTTADRARVLAHPPLRARRLVVPTSPLAAFADTGLGLNLRPALLAAPLVLDHLRRLDDIVATKNRVLRRVAATVRQVAGNVLEVAPVPRDPDGTLYALPLSVRSGGPVDATRRHRDEVVARLRFSGVRIVAASPPLSAHALFRDPWPVRAAASPVAHVRGGALPGAEAVGASGLRFDTRDMYEPWSERDHDDLAAALSAIGSGPAEG